MRPVQFVLGRSTLKRVLGLPRLAVPEIEAFNVHRNESSTTLCIRWLSTYALDQKAIKKRAIALLSVFFQYE
jgi:hypothetical protein